jgi:hypothetical protein
MGPRLDNSPDQPGTLRLAALFIRALSLLQPHELSQLPEH